MIPLVSCKGCSAASLKKYVQPESAISGGLLFINTIPNKYEGLLGKSCIGLERDYLREVCLRASKLSSNFMPKMNLTSIIWCHVDLKLFSNEIAWSCWNNNVYPYCDKVAPLEVVFLGKAAEKFAKPTFSSGTRFPELRTQVFNGGTSAPAFAGFCRSLSEIFLRIKETQND